MKVPFHALEVQGHRGARGLLPENSLPGFEIAVDLGVTSIETDVHLTRDDVAVLVHDPRLGNDDRLVRDLTLDQLRAHRVGSGSVLPLAESFAESCRIHPYGIPTLAEFFLFVAAYAGTMGEQAGKSRVQRECASRLIFDLELKRVPFEPETIGDGYAASGPAILEARVIAAIREAGVLERSRVRSFDHRSVRAVKQLEPSLQTGVLIHETAPCAVAALLAAAGADVYCPDCRFVDAELVRQVHAAKKRIIPYTVNEPRDWERLIAWGIDGITTDYPDRLLAWLAARSI